MKPLKRLLRWFTVVLGSLGVLLCVAAAAVVWLTGSRLSQATDKVFDGIDRSLTASRDRVLGAQKRVQESKITTADVGQGVENWMRREAPDRLASRLDVEHKAERLASGLEQADLWLEASGTSLQGVQHAFEVARSLGAPADVSVFGPLLERLDAMRRQLKESTETVDAIRQRLAAAAEGETLDERINRVATLALRVVATLGEIDTRLGEFADGLVATRARGEHLKSQTHAYIVAAQIGALLLIVWMAAGQVSLINRSI